MSGNTVEQSRQYAARYYERAHTLLLTEHELIALSTAILAYSDHWGHPCLESARVKIREQLNGRIARNYEDDYGIRRNRS